MNVSQFTHHNTDWEDTFQQLFDRAVNTYKGGTRDADHLLSNDESTFLASIGTSPQEVYDFVEDWIEDSEPTPEIIRQVTGIRRDYFLTVQDGTSSSKKWSSASLPSPGDTLGGYRWLPRIIEKARAKLRGELPPDIMYSCGMDRPFLKKHNIEPPEFLKVVWEAGEDQEKILEFVNKRANQREAVNLNRVSES